MNEITININGIECKAKEGEYVLNIARRNGIFIPALCYLTNCSPTLACRLCMVDIDGKRAYSCNAKAKDGMSVITSTEEIEEERQAIMKAYDVNHPLQCGVCDQSGECELQDYNTHFGISSQEYFTKDVLRKPKTWGLLHYDPGLCIVCERCVKVCKDMVGSNSLKTVPRGAEPLSKEWKEKMPKDAFAMWNKLEKSLIDMVGDDCNQCGECTAVCPVGALVTTNFQYRSNAWELEKIPASNPHSSDCSLMYYEVKRASLEDERKKIYRVTNDFHFAPLNAAARFGYDFENEVEKKDDEAFDKLIKLFEEKTIKQIKFSSFITNEEALILQKIKEKYGINLVNSDAYAYQKFLENFSQTSGQNLYSADIKTIQNSDFIVTLGTFLRNDNPNISYGVNNAMKVNKASGFYFHPLGDRVVESYSKNFKSVHHKLGSEEAVLYLLLDKFGEGLSEEFTKILASHHKTTTKTIKESYKEDVTQMVKDEESGEEKEVTKSVTKTRDKEVEVQTSSLYEMMGVDDLEDDFEKLLAKKEKFCLIVGEDLYSHPNAQKLAKLTGLVQKYTPFEVMIVPPKTNSLGVSLICELSEEKEGFTLGYNEKADFTLSALGNGDLDMPALNQQEGTFVSFDKRVVPTNAALPFNGYELNDIANALGIKSELTMDYTKELPKDKGFESKYFDDLPNFYDQGGESHRGYKLNMQQFVMQDFCEDIGNCDADNENLIYLANPINQFSPFTNKASQIQTTAKLHVSEEFLTQHGFKDGQSVLINAGGNELAISLQKDDALKGLIPYLPDFDTKVDVSGIFKDFRYTNAKIRSAR